ncbi:hypothetical protein KCU90_g59, partial [Aureobasidium melanogenum]
LKQSPLRYPDFEYQERLVHAFCHTVVACVSRMSVISRDNFHLKNKREINSIDCTSSKQTIYYGYDTVQQLLAVDDVVNLVYSSEAATMTASKEERTDLSSSSVSTSEASIFMAEA